MAERARVLALFGPTGVGKTDVAIALADRLREAGEQPVAVSADALQVYAGLEALTGAADAQQRARLEHRLLSFLPVEREFSVGEYATLAHGEIDGAVAMGRTPIVVGGTGLYLQAALCDLELRPPPPPQLRERLRDELASAGAGALHARLADADPEAAAAIEAGNGRRIVRALELLEMGLPPAPTGERSQLWTAQTRHPTALLGLEMDRDRLYERIDARVAAIVAAGAEDEVRHARAHGASRTARQALGFEALLNDDVEAMRRDTRRYAKRQLTWMRKLEEVQRIDVTGRAPDAVAEEICGLLHLGRAQA